MTNTARRRGSTPAIRQHIQRPGGKARILFARNQGKDGEVATRCYQRRCFRRTRWAIDQNDFRARRLDEIERLPRGLRALHWHLRARRMALPAFLEPGGQRGAPITVLGIEVDGKNAEAGIDQRDADRRRDGRFHHIAGLGDKGESRRHEYGNP